ncbi:MAG TPA: peptide ABC transporter substrate-binding protein [Candidatus Limnocylindria bacterium]|jgi:oligopeptide transport system substrate-binding protein|nr:peptide ABC transporter substrate-binding protein [Candidatus Limnocylindria bacterium]
MPVLMNALGKFPGAFFVLLLAGLLAGCRPEPPADLTVINGPDPGSLDPLLVTGIEELRAVLPLFEGLARPDPATSRAVPGLAERWEISADGRRYTFHLRTNAVWSTGAPITSADLVYSWHRVLEPTNACQYASLLYPVRNSEDYATGKLRDFAQVGVRAPDAHTVEVTLGTPCAWFLDLCAFQTLSVVPRAAIERDGDQWIMRHPPFSGPYELEYWRISDRVRLRRNERYWDAANTRSRIVDLLVMSSPATALNLYEDHQVDVILDKPLVPTELLPVLAKTPDYHTFPMLGSYFVRINVTRPPLNDPRVRRALALTVDKRRLTQRIAPTCEPADHIVPAATANYLRGEGQHLDPDLARRLLAEAGFPGGKGFPKLSYLADSSGGGGGRMNERVAVELQEMWRRELGIEIEIRSLEKKVAIVAQRNLDYDLSRSSWIGDYNDPNTFLDLFTKGNGNNRTGWSHPEYERLMREASGEADLAKRAVLLRQAETLLVRDEAPIIPLWFESGFTLNSPARVEGMYGNVLDVHPLNAIRRIPNSGTK